MAGTTKIEWADQVWNPLVGCALESPGCTNCYAMKMANRLQAMAEAGNAKLDHYRGTTRKVNGKAVWTGKLGFPEAAMLAPLRRKKATRYFVNSMSDLFHPGVPDEQIDRVFAVMALCPQHTFQVLTKRSARMREWMRDFTAGRRFVGAAIKEIGGIGTARVADFIAPINQIEPLPNVWLGVSVEDQTRADERIPDLLATPAAVRFISAEPLLGPLKIFDELGVIYVVDGQAGRIDWVIVGGESGQHARPMHPDWARSLRDQCAASGVPFFFKQWGEWMPLGQSGFTAWSAATGQKGNRRDAGKPFSLGYASFNDGAGGPEASRIGPVRTLHSVLTVGKSGGHTCARVGKKAAGHLLDGVEHFEFPA